MPIGPFLKARRHVHRRAAEAAHLRLVRREHAEAVRPDDAGAAQLRELDHLRDLGARDALGDDDDELDAGLDRLEDGVRVKRGGTVTIEPSTRCFAVMSRTQS